MAQDPSQAAALLAAQEALARALVARDTAALAGLLDDALVYVHSTGVLHDRAAYLRYVQDGPTFLSVRLADTRVLCAPGLAMLEGVLELTLRRAQDPEPVSLRSYAVQVWRLAPDGWRLRRAQTTKPA